MKSFRSMGAAGIMVVVATTAAAFECAGVVPIAGEDITLELVYDQFDRPVDVQAPPGDTERLFVVEQRGRIRIVDLASDTVLPEPFLDIASQVRCCGESGLLGLAFHPRYAENGFFFVNYTRNPPAGCESRESVIARFSVSAAPERADASSATVVMTYCQPFSNHNAGQIAFGPNDGYLYISTGDGGSGGDPQNHSQNPASLLGKMLRIDVESLPYTIPPDNPFVGVAGFRGEIWATGLRNPWRFAFDPANGDLYIADVGQGLWEEIDYQPGDSAGGENYEWRVREGNHAYDSGTNYAAGERVAPILEYEHDPDDLGGFRGDSVTGGCVYRGCRMPDLHGTYFFADYANNWVRSFRVVNGAVTDLRDRTSELNEGILPDRVDGISSFGTDGRGEMYICDLDTKLFRIVPVVADGETFRRGDANADGFFDISDGVRSLLWLFRGNQGLECLDAADSDDDGVIRINDAVLVFNSLFRDAGPPSPPFSGCGIDPVEDALDCASFPPCR